MSLNVRGGDSRVLQKEGLPLYATCTQCNHVSQLNVPHLGERFDWKTMLKDLAPRLRCMRCRQRGASLTVTLPVKRCPTCQRPI